MSYKTFAAKWLGARTDTDGYPTGAIYQCVDLVKTYMLERYKVPLGAYGNAIDYWTKPAAQVLKKFKKVRGSKAKQGDIIVLYGQPGNPFGHIGVATGRSTTNMIEMLEQNGSTGNGQGNGGDRVRTRYIDRDRVAGLLRPKLLAPITPAPKPPAPVPPAGKYVIHRTIPGYYNSADARRRRNAMSKVKPRTYAIFNRYDGMLNVTLQAGSPGTWINPADNKKSAAKYLIARRGEGLSHLARRAGYPDFGGARRWAAIAKLNGSSSWQKYNASLKPGKKVRVK